VHVREAKGCIGRKLLLGMANYYFLSEGFLEFGFLEVVAVCGLTSGDFSFLSFSDPFIFDY
jgi:hypothetical protein